MSDWGVTPCIQQGLFGDDQKDALLTIGKHKNHLLSSKSVSRHYLAFFYVMLEHSFLQVPTGIMELVWEWGERKSVESESKAEGEFQFFEELVDGWRLQFDLDQMERE